jgi:hypothetical protein
MAVGGASITVGEDSRVAVAPTGEKYIIEVYKAGWTKDLMPFPLMLLVWLFSPGWRILVRHYGGTPGFWPVRRERALGYEAAIARMNVIAGSLERTGQFPM